MCLAWTTRPEPFHRPGWVYEEKYDGYRIIAYKSGADVKLVTRNLKDRTPEFGNIARAIAKLRAPTLILDGEVAILDDGGVSRFQLLQRRGVDPAVADPVFVAFDCLYARGHDLREMPLADRRLVLQAEVNARAPLKISRRLAANGLRAFEKAKASGLEGLIAKDSQSVYVAGTRSDRWRKVKFRPEDEFVIGGFTAPQGARDHFGALLVGAYEGGKLRYAGKVGTGYSDRVLTDLIAQFRPLLRDTSPFADPVRERNVTWLEPRLVGQFAYTEITRDRLLRQPSFLGLRTDKAPRDVRWPKNS